MTFSSNDFYQIAHKLSVSGYFFNERLIRLSQGQFSYFSKIPPKFNELNPKIPDNFKPKLSANLYDIEVSPIEDSDIQKFSRLQKKLCFKILAKNLVINFDNPKKTNSNKLESSIFYFKLNSKEEKDSVLKKILAYKAYYHKQAAELQEKQQNSSLSRDSSIDNSIIKKGSKEFNLSMISMEEDIHKSNENINIDGTEESIVFDMKQIDLAESKQEKNEIQKLKEEGTTKSRKNSKAIKKNQNWEQAFSSLLEGMHILDQKIENIISYGETFLYKISEFRDTAIEYIKKIVYEKILKEEDRTIKSVKNDKLYGFLKIFVQGEENADVYMIDNIVIKIANKSKVLTRNILGIPFSESYWKYYGREFRSYDILFDSIYIMPKMEDDFDLKVPITFIFDFLGFRCFACSNIPTSYDPDPIIGINQTGVYHTVCNNLSQEDYDSIVKILSNIAEILNINDTIYNGIKSKTPASPLLKARIEIHRKARVNIGLGAETSKISNGFYELESTVSSRFLSDIYYLFKSSEIFPVMFDPFKTGDQQTYFRQEFIQSYTIPIQPVLNNKIFREKKATSRTQSSNEADRVREHIDAKAFFEDVTIIKLVEHLESIEILPLDSKTLTKAFHSHGVNMCFLGKVANKSKLDHVTNICVVEIIARLIKNLFNGLISDHILNLSNNQDEMNDAVNLILLKENEIATEKRHSNKDDLNKSNDSSFHDIIEKNTNEDPFHKYYIKCLQEYLEIIFGNSNQSEDYWNSIIIPKSQELFYMDKNNLNKKNINLNALYISIIYHLGLEIQLNSLDKIGSNELLFYSSHIKDIKGKLKMYKFRTLPYCVVSESYKAYIDSGKLEFAAKSLKIKISINNTFNNEPDLYSISKLAELLLDNGEIDLALIILKKALSEIKIHTSEDIQILCVLIRAYFQMGTEESFKLGDNHFLEAFEILTFQWGIHHPLHAILYLLYSSLIIRYKNNLIQAVVLYRASIECCIKVLYPNHIFTGQVYLELGRLQLKLSNRESALENIKNAYIIFDNSNKNNEIIIEMGKAAYEASCILENMHKAKDALNFALKATEIFLDKFGGSHPIYICSLWLLASIYYTLKNDNQVIKYCRLIKHYIDEYKKVNYEIMKEFDQKIQNIKEKCVATIILTKTRMLSSDEKGYIDKVVKLLLSHWHEKSKKGQNSFESTYFNLNNDIIDISSLNDLQFSLQSKYFLNEIFSLENDEISNQGKSIEIFYDNIIMRLITLYETQISNMQKSTYQQDYKKFIKTIENPEEIEVEAFKQIVLAFNKYEYLNIIRKIN